MMQLHFDFVVKELEGSHRGEVVKGSVFLMLRVFVFITDTKKYRSGNANARLIRECNCFLPQFVQLQMRFIIVLLLLVLYYCYTIQHE